MLKYLTCSLSRLVRTLVRPYITPTAQNYTRSSLARIPPTEPWPPSLTTEPAASALATGLSLLCIQPTIVDSPSPFWLKFFLNVYTINEIFVKRYFLFIVLKTEFLKTDIYMLDVFKWPTKSRYYANFGQLRIKCEFFTMEHNQFNFFKITY